MDKKFILFLAFIFSFAILFLFGLFVWPTAYRYGTIKFGKDEFPLKMHRITNEVSYCDGTRWISSPKSKKETKDIEPLQFSDTDRDKLLKKQGLTSIKDKPIGNIPFVQLGKPLPQKTIKNWLIIPKHYEMSLENWDADNAYYCDLKDEVLPQWNLFAKTLVLYSKDLKIKGIKWILEIDGKNFLLLKREYMALGYEFAEKYGLPIKDVFEIDKGYADNVEEAFKYERAKAKRIYLAKEGEVRISIYRNDIRVEYELKNQNL